MNKVKYQKMNWAKKYLLLRSQNISISKKERTSKNTRIRSNNPVRKAGKVLLVKMSALETAGVSRTP